MKTIQFLVCVFFFEGHFFGGWRYFSAELHVGERKSPWESHFLFDLHSRNPLVMKFADHG